VFRSKNKGESIFPNIPALSTFFSIALFLIVSLPSLSAQAEPTPFQLVTRIPVAAKFFTTDKLQQVYLVTPANEVIKFNSEGQELFRFNNNTLGDLTFIDATNPFNLLLYYPDYQLAITLDRTLNKIGEFNLWNLEVVNVKAVAMANDNGLWLYDDVGYKLKKVDQSGNTLLQSDNLSLLLPATPEPVALLARDNLIYANDPNLGILVFDNFGQYIKTYDLREVENFQVIDRRLLYRVKGQLRAFDLRAFTDTALALPAGTAPHHQVRLEKDYFYVLKEDGLEVYRMVGR